MVVWREKVDEERGASGQSQKRAGRETNGIAGEAEIVGIEKEVALNQERAQRLRFEILKN